MMPADRKEFWLAAFAAMCQCWPFFEPTPERIRVFDAALSDLGLRELDYGVRWVLANHSGHWPPSPGNIRDAVFGPITKVAVTRVDGKVVRWEQKRLPPQYGGLAAPTMNLRALASPHGQDLPNAPSGDRRREGVLPPAKRLDRDR